jgi:L-lysine 2,3-aminomutase
MDAAFKARLGGRRGEERLAKLLELCDFAFDFPGFAQALLAQLAQANGVEARPIVVGGLELPYHLLLSLMELLLPGRGFKTIKTVGQLEAATNVAVSEEERRDLQTVLERYPVRLSYHTLRQMRLSSYVTAQYHPFVGELDQQGEVNTWVGQFHWGVVERMYQNRVIFIMNMACPVYCRFCFRKHKECRNQKAPTQPQVKQGVQYLRQQRDVREVVLTGGDAFMNRPTLQYAIGELGRIAHIKVLRLATRSIAYYPELFLQNNGYWLDYLVKTGLELQRDRKRLEVATHFIHPDELSVDALDVISHLVHYGVHVYVQTPFVSGCNDGGPEMVSLFNTLRAIGAEIHYIFMPTSPIQGNQKYWAPISRGLAAGRYLRNHLSDRAIPHLTTATSIGKIDWNTSGWVVEGSAEDPRYLWLRTPYTKDYIEHFAAGAGQDQAVRLNAEGTLDARFMAELGDQELALGQRQAKWSVGDRQVYLEQTQAVAGTFLRGLQEFAASDQRTLQLHLGRPGLSCLARQHKVQVELDCGAPEPALAEACQVIAATPALTDVILSAREGTLRNFSKVLGVVERLLQIPHLAAVRLRCLAVTYSPHLFERAAIRRLAALNPISLTSPKRIELETWFLHSSEYDVGQEKLVQELRQRGISVYANTALLGRINDNREEVLNIGSLCRDLGVEFCNVYIAGLPLQREWNENHPIHLGHIIDIASYVRRNSSGRSVPRYLVRTALGDADFSLAPAVFVRRGPEVAMRLVERDLAYYRTIDPGFEWPRDVELDQHGWPCLPLTGVVLPDDDLF